MLNNFNDIYSQEFDVYGNNKIKLLSDHFQIGSEGISQWNEFRFEMTPLRKKWFLFKSRIERNKMNVNITPTEWFLVQVVTSFNEDEKYIFIAKFTTLLIFPVTNAWPERGASAVKRVKTRMRSTMKNGLLNGLLHISINGPTSHDKEAKVVVTRAAEKYDSSRRNHRSNKSRAVMPSNPSVAVQVDLALRDLLR